MSSKSKKGHFPHRITLGEVEVMNSRQYRHREAELEKKTAKLERSHSMNMLSHQRCLNETKQFLRSVQTVDDKGIYVAGQKTAKRATGKADEKPVFEPAAEVSRPPLSIAEVGLPRSHNFLQNEAKPARKRSLYSDPFDDVGSENSEEGPDASTSPQAPGLSYWARRASFSTPSDAEKHLRKATNNKNSFWKFKDRQKAIMLRASICNTLFSMLEKKKEEEGNPNPRFHGAPDNNDDGNKDRHLRQVRVRGRSFSHYRGAEPEPEEEYNEVNRRISAKYNEQVGKLRQLTRAFSRTSLATVPVRRPSSYRGGAGPAAESKDSPIDVNSNSALKSPTATNRPSSSLPPPTSTPRRKMGSVISPSVISIQ